jgi:hypothetical protein
MKKIVAFLLAAALLLSAVPGIVRADMMLPFPPVPERKTPQKVVTRRETVPLYSLAAGLTAMALTGSLIALQLIRWRNEKAVSETPADAGDKTPE